MRRRYRGVLLGVATATTLGCFGDRNALQMAVAPAEAIARVDATPDNTILAIGGTGQLAMTATSIAGTPLTNFDSVAFRNATASDSSTVRVSSTGLLTGLASTGAAAIPINIVAFRAHTWSGDQVLVQVTPTAVAGLTLSIQPPAGDSAKLASGTPKTITPVIRNGTGQSVAGLLQYAVKPADESRVGVFTGFVRIRDVFNADAVHVSLSPAAAVNQIVPYVGAGSSWIYADVNAYGTLLQDSVMYTFTYPYTGTVVVTKSNLAVRTTLNAGTAISPTDATPDLILAPGATVTFSNGIAATDPLTVAFAFDNPTGATAATPASTIGGATGNVTTLTGSQTSRRQFLTPGRYRWTWVAAGGPVPWNGETASGTIVIK